MLLGKQKDLYEIAKKRGQEKKKDKNDKTNSWDQSSHELIFFIYYSRKFY